MSTRQRPTNTPNEEKQKLTNQSSEYVVYRIGIHGWRKRCLYFLVLLILIIAIINLALLVWIMRVQDFGLHGMGKLHITTNGIRMDGTAEFMKALRVQNIMSRGNAPLKITSRKNISLNAVDALNNVVGQITLDSNQIVLKNDKLIIQDNNGKTLLYADDKKFTMNTDNMEITVPGGLNFENSVQTPLIQASDKEDLRIESLTRKLYMNAADSINIKSNVHDIRFESLMDMSFTTKKGNVLLDAKKILLSDLRQSTVPGKNENDADIHKNIAEVCMCSDGTLFLAPADAGLPCKVTSGVCV